MTIQYKRDTKKDLTVISGFEELICKYSNEILAHMSNCLGGTITGFRIPRIVFDDSNPISRYDGNKTAYKVRKDLISLVSEYPDVQPRLKDSIKELGGADQEGSILDRLYGLRHIITDILNDSESNPYDKEFAKKATGIIISLKTGDKTINSVLGRYYPKTNKIVIYYKSIGYYPDSPNFSRSFIAKVVITLAHEMFHAFHYALAGDNYLSSDYHSTVVEEASADFYSCIYCLATGDPELIQEASHRYCGWKEWFLSKWPYAKALYYLRLKNKPTIDNGSMLKQYNEYVKYGSIKKLVEVLDLSRHSMEEAYHALVYNEDIFFTPYRKRKKGKETGDNLGVFPSGHIVEFSIIHHPGTWGANIPPHRYTIKLRDRKIDEIHYRTNEDNPQEGYRITLKAGPYLIKEFFYVVNGLDWSKDYVAPLLDAGSWAATLTYENGAQKMVHGMIDKPVGAERLNELFQEMYADAGYPDSPYLI